jgi:hypothetical protein
MKTYRGVDGKIHVFLTSALVGGVSFTPLPIYTRGKIPRYPLARRLGGHQNSSGRRGEDHYHSGFSQQPIAVPAALSPLPVYLGQAIKYVFLFISITKRRA